MARNRVANHKMVPNSDLVGRYLEEGGGDRRHARPHGNFIAISNLQTSESMVQTAIGQDRHSRYSLTEVLKQWHNGVFPPIHVVQKLPGRIHTVFYLPRLPWRFFCTLLSGRSLHGPRWGPHQTLNKIIYNIQLYNDFINYSKDLLKTHFFNPIFRFIYIL